LDIDKGETTTEKIWTVDVRGVNQFAYVFFQFFCIRKLLFRVLCLENAVKPGDYVTVYLERRKSQSTKIYLGR
jgi:hypothetical protein